VMAAATSLWADDTHVEENRRRYREKIDLAARILGNRAGFYRPPGGFFLWLDVGDGVAVASELWRRFHVKTLPGAYLTAAPAASAVLADPALDFDDPGTRYLRVALVHEPALLAPALDALGTVLT
jgi:N-succinyldiaminopimelate aminotransferase